MVTKLADRDRAALRSAAAVRVLIVTNMYPSPGAPARGTFVREQVEALRELDALEVELFAFSGGGARAYARAAVALRRRFAGHDFDVVHAHYGLSGLVALALGGAPLVVTFHGTDLEHARVAPVSRAVARAAALPAPVSASLARAAGLTRLERCAVLPCGVNMERFTPLDRADSRLRLRLDPDGRYLLFPADPRRREKRHDRAAAVAAALEAELLTYRDVAPDEVPVLINAANAVVATSEREGFGLAPLEALACDVAVASTPVGIAPVALAGIGGTLCAAFDLSSWSAALRPHVEDPQSRVAGRERAALFERRRLAQRVANAYRDIARERL